MDTNNTHASPETGTEEMQQAVAYAILALSVIEPQPVPSGMRLATINYKLMEKQKKAGKAKPENKGVFVPLIKVGSFDFGCMPGDNADTDSNTNLRALLVEKLAEEQDELIRKHINEGKTELNAEDINAAALVSFMAAAQDSKRLSKESIGSFFDSELAATLGAMVCNKAGWDAANLSLENAASIAKATAQYREAFCKLAAVSPSLPKDDAERMLRVVSGSESQQPIAAIIAQKLERIINPQVVVNLAAI